MTPIVFDDIASLSEEGLSIEERNAIAQKVHTEHGVSGLVTLWACLDYYDPTDVLDGGMTPAAQWWLTAHNPYSAMVKNALSNLSESDALDLLKKATFTPLVELKMWGGMDNKHMELFSPEEPEKYSHSYAGTVRRVAEQFFPQYPNFTKATCSIYLDVGEHDSDLFDDGTEESLVYAHHSNTLEAFHDDSAALQYLVRVHKDRCAQREYASPEIIALLSPTDAEWAMYDDMGLSPEDAYEISKSLVVPPAVLPLPTEFNA